MEVQLSHLRTHYIRINVNEDGYDVTIRLSENPVHKEFGKELLKLGMKKRKTRGLDEHQYNVRINPTNIGKFVGDYNKLVKIHKSDLPPSYTTNYFNRHKILRLKNQERTWNKRRDYDTVKTIDVALRHDLVLN